MVQVSQQCEYGNPSNISLVIHQSVDNLYIYKLSHFILLLFLVGDIYNVSLSIDYDEYDEYVQHTGFPYVNMILKIKVKYITERMVFAVKLK